MSIHALPNGTSVRDVVQRLPVKIRKTDTVHDALEELIAHQISALPVIDDSDCLVGIISINDLMKLLHSIEHTLEESFPRYEDCYWVAELIQQRFGSDYVSSVMTESLATVSPESTLQQAAQLMLERECHHLPVTDTAGRVVGILSSFDFVRLAATAGA